MSGGRFIAETLKGYGITHIFFMEAILREVNIQAESLGISRILGHSEKAVAYMADGYARVGHKPGVCMAQSVGAANLAAALQDAYLASSPVIAITGRQAPLAQYRHAYQEISHGPMFDPVTKYNVNVDTVEQLPHIMRQAFREATSGAPGPVHLDVLDNMGRIIELAEAEMEVLVEERFAQYPSFRPVPEWDSVKDAAHVLEQCARPVIVAGGGVAASGAGPEVLELADTLSIPIVTSLNGKGAVVENHPLSVGVVGSYSRWCANRVVSEADLVVFVGSHTGDQVTNGWRVPSQGTPVVQIDIDPSELGRNYPNTVGLMGDAKVTLRELMRAINPKAAKKDKWSRHAQRTVKAWYEQTSTLRQSDATPIRTERLCQELSELLPPNSILVSCTGYSGIWTGTMVELNHPGQSYIRAAGSLGWGFPASLGARCAAPDRPVVCFTGDGGILYHLSELETASRRGINTVTVVNNNSSYAQCNHNIAGVEYAYGHRQGNREELYKFQDIDFAKIAEEMGCLGIRVEKAEDISKALRTALASDRPSVVDVITDEDCEAQWPWAPD